MLHPNFGEINSVLESRTNWKNYFDLAAPMVIFSDDFLDQDNLKIAYTAQTKKQVGKVTIVISRERQVYESLQTTVIKVGSQYNLQSQNSLLLLEDIMKPYVVHKFALKMGCTVQGSVVHSIQLAQNDLSFGNHRSGLVKEKVPFTRHALKAIHVLYAKTLLHSKDHRHFGVSVNSQWRSIGRLNVENSF